MNMQKTASLMLPLLFASGAAAQIQWTQSAMQPPYESGYLPRLATDLINNWALISATGPGFAYLATDSGIRQSASGQPVTWASYGGSLESPPAGGAVIGHAPSLSMFPAYAGYTAIYKTIFLEVHQGTQDNGAQLWYTLGTCALNADAECVSGQTWLASQEYDAGFNPSASIDVLTALNGGKNTATVIEIHQSGQYSSGLWYHLGTLNYSTSGQSVVWGPAIPVTNPTGTAVSGFAPSISVAAGYVVTAYQAGGGTLAYVFGKISGNTVKWQNPVNYDTGYNPSIAMLGPGLGTEANVVEAHQGDPSTGPLYYRLGTWDSQTSPTGVTWTPNSSYKYADSGCYPTLALAIGVDVGELHSTTCGVDSTLSFSSGYLVSVFY
jgi:hypothetical protein